MNIEEMFATMTMQQINSILYGQILGCFIFLIIAIVGIVFGARTQNEVAKYIGFAVGVISALGAILFFQQAMELAMAIAQQSLHP